jgi:hypothetical protein
MQGLVVEAVDTGEEGVVRIRAVEVVDPPI